MIFSNQTQVYLTLKKLHLRSFFRLNCGRRKLLLFAIMRTSSFSKGNILVQIKTDIEPIIKNNTRFS